MPVSAFDIPKGASYKSDADADMQNCEVTSQTHQIGSSAKPLGPEQSAHLEKIRTILGTWTEPVLVAYGNYTRHPELGPGLVKMLQVCCEAARQITNAVGAAIALGQGPNFIYVARSGKLVSSIGVRVDAESNFLGACVKSGRTFISHCTLTDPRVDPAVRQLGVKSLSAIPLVINDHVLGVLEVYSLAESNFDTNKVVSLQFLSKLLREALSEFQQSKKGDLIRNNPALATAEPAMATHSFAAPAHLVGLDAASAAPHGKTNATPLKEDATRSHPQLQQGTEPPVSSSQVLSKIAEPLRKTELPSQIAFASSTSSTERRSLPRTLVESLTYVSFGEENGGILLDINEAGFSMQTAMPLDGANFHRRARFSGTGDFEIDCSLVWDKSGQAGFKFSNVADLRMGLESWIAANGLPPLSLSITPSPERTQIAATLAKLDELRCMLLNSRLSKESP